MEKFVLWSTKWTPDQLKQITDVIGQVQSVISAFGSLFGAYNTVMSVLEFVGILGKKDPWMAMRAQLAQFRQEMLKGLAELEHQDRLDQLGRWQWAVEQAGTAIDNIHTSPGSAEYQRDVKDAFKLISAALFEMLNTADITELGGKVPFVADLVFSENKYGWPSSTYEDPPGHWVPYAMSPWMFRGVQDAQRQEIHYWDIDRSNSDAPFNRSNNSARIWDPSYYLDLLPTAAAYYVSLMSVREPAFQATKYNRKEIREIADLLKGFVETWRNSLLVTNPDAFLLEWSPGQGSALHPYNNPYAWPPNRGIPLGVVDPVSGVMFFEPLWNRGFKHEWVYPQPPISGSPYDVIANVPEAKTIAYDAIKDAIEVVEATCGIATIRDIQKQFESLAEYGLYGSKFSRLEWPKKTFEPFTMPAMWMSPLTEYLHLLGSKAVHGVMGWGLFKRYPARRFLDRNGGGKLFRMPIARRMFVSEVQLGYRLVFHVLGSKQSSTEVVLTTYNTPGIKGDQASLPPPPAPQEVVVDDATLYDVVQNKPFSVDDEDQSESGHPHPDRERLFINPRQGKVSIRIEVEFQLDLNDPAWPYLGYANIRIVNLDPEPKAAFIVGVSAYEKANLAWGTYMPELIDGVWKYGTIVEKPETETSVPGFATVHIIPSYLVADQDYFDDRAAMGVVIDKSILALTYEERSIPHKIWRGPQFRYSDFAENEARSLRTYERLAQQYPERMAAVTARFLQPQVLEWMDKTKAATARHPRERARKGETARTG